MVTVSSQDLRNAYQKFYTAIRRYLWPFDVLKDLSDLEVDIYTAFADVSKLRADFAKVEKDIKDTLNEDEYLAEQFKKLRKLVDSEDVGSFHRLMKVNETNPEEMKQLRTIPKDKEAI